MAISRFLQRLSPPRSYDELALPEHPIVVIGDLHGRADLLERLLAQLTVKPDTSQTRLIFVGDVIDRGPDSERALARVRHLCEHPAPFHSVICLLGNHERMLLDFIEDPVRHGPLWLTNGGDTTLASFGISAHSSQSGAGAPGSPALVLLRDALLEKLPVGAVEWLSRLPLKWQEGQLVVTHAGADPNRAIADQTEKNMIWGHAAFRSRLRTDGVWIAHGHYIVRAPTSKEGRIAVDTGAWRTGRLTAARISSSGVRFLQT